MKIKLQTLLKHNWRTLLLLCTLITASQAVWAATLYVRGTIYDNWEVTANNLMTESPTGGTYTWIIKYSGTTGNKSFKIADSGWTSGSCYGQNSDGSNPSDGVEYTTRNDNSAADMSFSFKNGTFYTFRFISSTGKLTITSGTCSNSLAENAVNVLEGSKVCFYAGVNNGWDTKNVYLNNGTIDVASNLSASAVTVSGTAYNLARVCLPAGQYYISNSSKSSWGGIQMGEESVAGKIYGLTNNGSDVVTSNTGITPGALNFDNSSGGTSKTVAEGASITLYAASNTSKDPYNNPLEVQYYAKDAEGCYSLLYSGDVSSNSNTATFSLSLSAGVYTLYALLTDKTNHYVYIRESNSLSLTVISCTYPSAPTTITASPATVCAGSSSAITTNEATGGYTYKLYNGSSFVGGPIELDDDDELDFGSVTPAATTTYTVYAMGTGSGCEYTRVGSASATVSVNANPDTPSITSYDEYVCGGAAPTFTFSSTSGLVYQMYVGGSTSGDYITGDGSSQTLTADDIDEETTFTLRATNSTTGCYSSSSGATVGITPDMALTSITLTPSNICVGGTSEVSLTGLNVGGVGVVTYTSGTPAVATIAAKDPATAGATASGVSVGTSIITATVSGGCGSAPDPKTATLNVKAAPTAYTLSASGESEAYICSAGGTLTLSGSQSGYSYQLKKDGSASGAAKTGTGSALEFTVYESGEFTCEAYLTGSPDCKTDMTGTVILHISLTPALLPATPTVKNYEPVTITSINTDIETWTISNAGNTAYLYNITSNSATVKASKANSPYTVTATTPGGCSSTVTVTVGDYAETCVP